MKKLFLIAPVGLVILLSSYFFRTSNPTAAFINSLSEEQKAKALKALDDDSVSIWHFFPSSMFKRTGISLSALSSNQQELVFDLLEDHLSESGYKKIRSIHDLENVLAELTGNTEMRDPENYYVAFYGDPLKDALWLWSFEGHHISLKFIINDEKISIAPRFLGANPAKIPEGSRKGERVLKNEEDLGFELIRSMSENQRSIALFREKAFPDIVTSNAAEVNPLDPVGIKASELNPEQRALLLALLDEYISILPEEEAKEKTEKLKQTEFDQVRFGWAGSLKMDEPHYYRIQGKTFLIEFDNSQNNVNHIHTVWRDFKGDFGRDLIREHYENSDHH